MWEECHYLVGNEKMNHFWSMKNMHVRFWVVIFAALSTFDDNNDDDYEDSIIDWLIVILDLYLEKKQQINFLSNQSINQWSMIATTTKNIENVNSFVIWEIKKKSWSSNHDHHHRW